MKATAAEKSRLNTLVSADDPFSQTLRSIRSRSATIGVIGLGYVGLPLVRLFAKAGYPVLGFDCDQEKVNKLRRGESYIKHLAGSEIVELMASNRFEPTSDIARLAESQAIVICVPTPLSKNREPDLSYVEGTCRDILGVLRDGQLVVLESTTYPGTTRDICKPILESRGKKCGEHFFLAFSPEREDPGNPKHSAAFIPKVVGGLDPKSHELAVELYRPVVPQVVEAPSAEVAEACKILENTYRCVNIALVNELKILFEKMGIDIWEVIRAASTKPFGFQPFYPGPGLGGHCIPIDPFYLSWIARQHNFHTRFIELAGEVNTSMPDYVISRITLALNQQCKSIRGSKVGILGMAYKKDVDDPRESPSFELMERLVALGADVSYNDPFIPVLPPMRHYDFEGMTSKDLTPEYLGSLDCLLIATDHSTYEWDRIVRLSRLVVDTRNATRDVLEHREKIWAA
jgi:UDP-N-acetyl-D-glucosamine dehydrogenase